MKFPTRFLTFMWSAAVGLNAGTMLADLVVGHWRTAALQSLVLVALAASLYGFRVVEALIEQLKRQQTAQIAFAESMAARAAQEFTDDRAAPTVQ